MTSSLVLALGIGNQAPAIITVGQNFDGSIDEASVIGQKL